MMDELADRWEFRIKENEVDDAISQSPDGLVHAGLSTDHLTLCERVDDKWLGGDRTYVRLNLDLPGASTERHYVTCQGCLEVMHS